MKILISIASCLSYTKTGENQIARDLWLNNLPSGVYVKFLLGNGQPTEQQDSDVQQSWVDRGDRYKGNTFLTSSFDYTPLEDELLLSLPDSYKHCTYKIREGYRWALDNDFDFVFQGCVDTYIDVHRLINSGFEEHDYIGDNHGFAACGGKGYWLSRKALEVCKDSHVDTWAWDSWTGSILGKNGIVLHDDKRYAAYPTIPRIDNNIITSHLNISPEIYSINKAREVYKEHRRLYV
jgi:hypothetical protein